MTCSCCKYDLDTSLFPKAGGQCKACVSRKAAKAYLRRKLNPDYVERREAYNKRWNEQHRDYHINYAKEFRASGKGKEYRKKYNALNKDKLIVHSRKSNRKRHAEITDGYVTTLLKRTEKHITQDAIDLKRIEILTRRIKIKVNGYEKQIR